MSKQGVLLRPNIISEAITPEFFYQNPQNIQLREIRNGFPGFLRQMGSQKSTQLNAEEEVRLLYAIKGNDHAVFSRIWRKTSPTSNYALNNPQQHAGLFGNVAHSFL